VAEPVRVNVREAGLEPGPDPVCGALEHRRPGGERAAAILHREDACPAGRGDQPAALARRERLPPAADPVDPPAPLVRVGHQQRLAPPRRRPPARAVDGRGPVQVQVAVHGRQGVVGDPGRTELAALGDPGRDRERDRHLHRTGRQRRDLPGQQRAELLQPHPGRQRQLPDRGVAGQLTAPVIRVRAAIRRQAPQPVQEQLGEVRLQVLDRHVRLRDAADRQVHPDLPARPGEQRPRRPVGERLGLRMALLHRPPVEQRQDAHVPAPRRRREPPSRRACRPVPGVLAERELQPVTRAEQPDPVPGQELSPFLQHPGIALPRARRRAAARRQLTQPPVHHRHRPR